LISGKTSSVLPSEEGGLFCVPWKRRRTVRELFVRLNAMAAGLLKKNAAWSDYLADYRTALEYDRSNITPRFRDGKQKTIFARTIL
jgi:hypothetical protein